MSGGLPSSTRHPSVIGLCRGARVLLQHRCCCLQPATGCEQPARRGPVQTAYPPTWPMQHSISYRHSSRGERAVYGPGSALNGPEHL